LARRTITENGEKRKRGEKKKGRVLVPFFFITQKKKKGTLADMCRQAGRKERKKKGRLGTCSDMLPSFTTTTNLML